MSEQRTLEQLRTSTTNRLVAEYDPDRQLLYVRHRGEECVFDLRLLAARGEDELVVVRSRDVIELNGE